MGDISGIGSDHRIDTRTKFATKRIGDRNYTIYHCSDSDCKAVAVYFTIGDPKWFANMGALEKQLQETEGDQAPS